MVYPWREKKSMPLTAVQKRAIREIVAYVRRENLSKGFHLTEMHLASILGTSRTPIQTALAHLAKLGVVRRDPNRGYFLHVGAADLADVAKEWMSVAEDPLYQKVADARLSRKLPDTVHESDLIRLFRVSRSVIRRTLSRIQEEGWVQRQPGHGWSFLSTIDSVEAYEESYVFRMTVEPSGFLTAAFRPDTAECDEIQRLQEFIVAGGYSSMSAIELFEANARFHEALAKWSGNRFILHSVRRMNQLRRLIEYRQATKPRLPRKTHAEEHLAILAKIKSSDLVGAASLLRQHLDSARRQKISSGLL